MSRPRVNTLWAGVALGFGLLLCAWTAMILVARHTPVAVVPLSHQAGGGTR